MYTLKSCFYNSKGTQLAQAIDVIMAQLSNENFQVHVQNDILFCCSAGLSQITQGLLAACSILLFQEMLSDKSITGIKLVCQDQTVVYIHVSIQLNFAKFYKFTNLYFYTKF